MNFSIFKFAKKEKIPPQSSEFSNFFREASSGTKKKVFLKVAEKANREQLELIKSVSASVR